MRKEICKVVTDNGGVNINGIYFPCDGDGIKSVILTDETEVDFSKPFVDLRENDLKIYGFDRFGNTTCTEFGRKTLGALVSIQYESESDSILIVKYKLGETK